MSAVVQEFKVTTTQDISGSVVSIEDFSGKYGPSYKITIDTGDFRLFEVLEKKERIDKALKDCSLSRDTVIGRSIRIWKKPMEEDPRKGYLNISVLDTGRSANPVSVPAKPAPTTNPHGSTQLPGWLDAEAKEAQIKEQARADFDWAWNVAWGIMAPKIEGSGSAMGDPMVIQATQAAAIGLVIRLEHTRR